MGEVIAFSCRSILAAALEEIGGTEPQFANVSVNNGFRRRMSFNVPNIAESGVMENVTTVGVLGATEADAEERACVAALRILWQEHKYVVLDYSLLRVWVCAERYCNVVEKLEQSKSIFEAVSTEAFNVFDSDQSGPSFFLQRIAHMRTIGVDGGVISSALSCVGFLQMMHVRGAVVRQEATDRFDGLNNREDIIQLLAAAGFQVPMNDVVYTKISGGMNLLIRSYSATLRRHPCGEELAEKLEALAAEIHQCLTAITDQVRLMNENAVVTLLPF